MKSIPTEIPEEILEIYTENSLEINDYEIESESKEYKACLFTLNNKKCLYRHSKITPKKNGQFVTFWKRNTKGIIEPFHENDGIDFYLITVKNNEKIGQFIFPKSILIQKNIISTDIKEGKRGFRVYPSWDNPESKQAKKTQQWQLKSFFEFNANADIKILI